MNFPPNYSSFPFTVKEKDNSWSYALSQSTPKSLVLPPIMTFSHLPYPERRETYWHPFPPLFGLNMKFGNGKPMTFPTTKINFSIDSLTSKTSMSGSKQSLEEDKENKPDVILKNRGRPSADSIQLLKQKSLENPHRYKCPDCNRSFPRKKSLDTHKLIHSDVKPHACDFPGCNRKFKQSGQLKTHIRLHTGEKPFRCTYPLCNMSFTHSNRKCPHHPEYPLQRMASEQVVPSKLYDNIYNFENTESDRVRLWLHKQLAERSSNHDSRKSNILEPIQNKLSDEKATEHSEETDRRFLSAVALVELQDQTKERKGDNLTLLFTDKQDI